jgi:hypothetical protein
MVRANHPSVMPAEATKKPFKLIYESTSTLSRFHASTAFVRGVKGPIGSGKSVGCCVEIFIRAQQQHPSIDGIRRTRWAIVRNTGPELETTTIKTWLDWFPEEIFGRMNRKPPINHNVKIQDIELEVIFLALDRPDDVKKLLSLEVTGIFFNETRFIHKDHIDGGTGRVGRYPAKREKPDDVHPDNWPTWYGIIMDTNPPDDDHWWYKAAEEETPNGWAFWDQPSGLSADAENIENLPKGYYDRIVEGKDAEWVKVYVHGKYGSIQDGKPVYGASYRDDLHCSRTPLKAIPMVPLDIGLDFGNTPAAIITQVTPLGQRLFLEELVCEDVSIQDFAVLLKQLLDREYPGQDIKCFGDPSGAFKDQQQKTAFDLMRAKGIVVRPAPSNNIKMRTESVIHELNRMVNGQPAFLVDGKKCPTFRRGLNGGYKYKRMNVSGGDRYELTPDKNKFSHVHDSAQYVILATGGHRAITRGANKNLSAKTVMNRSTWSVWDT